MGSAAKFCNTGWIWLCEEHDLCVSAHMQCADTAGYCMHSLQPIARLMAQHCQLGHDNPPIPADWDVTVWCAPVQIWVS